MARMMMIAAVSGFLAVAIGAFGAHAFQESLVGKQLAWMETAQRYHFFHTLALLAICALAMTGAPAVSSFFNNTLTVAAWAFVLGILLFSGTLYFMAFSGNTALVALVPIGGLIFLLGWLSLLFAGFKWLRDSKTAR